MRLAGLAGLSCLVATHGLRIGASLSGGPAEGRPTASGRSTSSRCAPTTNMSVTLLPEEDPLSLYQEAKAQQMSDPLLEGLLRQTFGALEDKVMLGALEDKVMLFEDKVMLLENANEALQKQLRWAEEGTPAALLLHTIAPPAFADPARRVRAQLRCGSKSRSLA